MVFVVGVFRCFCGWVVVDVAALVLAINKVVEFGISKGWEYIKKGCVSCVVVLTVLTSLRCEKGLVNIDFGCGRGGGEMVIRPPLSSSSSHTIDLDFLGDKSHCFLILHLELLESLRFSVIMYLSFLQSTTFCQNMGKRARNFTHITNMIMSI